MKPNDNYFKELFRVSKIQIIFGGNYFNLPHSEGWICWDKTYKYNQKLNVGEFELAWTNMDIKHKFLRFTSCGNFQGFENPRARYDKKKSFHPTSKPIEIYEWLLMNYATCKTCKNQGGYYEDVAGDGGSQMWQVCDDCDTHERPVRILDTHLGSGSIAIACHNLGFELTACELDTDYYNAAMKRINEHKQQARLF